MNIYQDVAEADFMNAYTSSPDACVVHVAAVVERRECVLDYKMPLISASSVAMVDLTRLGLFDGLAIASIYDPALYDGTTDGIAEIDLLRAANLGGLARACGDDPLFCAWPSDPWHGLEAAVSGFWLILMRLLGQQRT